MDKFKKFAITLIITLILPTVCLALEDEYDELDYVWVEEEIKNAVEEKEPNISSRYAVVFDRSSKTAIWGKNSDKEVPMASTTKIMTAIVALENIKNLDEKVKVCKQAGAIGGSRLGLKSGDEITYRDLLYGLLLCSGNDAAVQIAVSVGENLEGFASLMNQKAKELKLEHSHFITPHGLDNEGHYTTAYELAIITDYALNIDMFSKIVATKNYTVSINGYLKNINNTNELLGYLEGVNGVKTGFTNGAGRCLVTSTSRNDFNIITVVLGADTKKIRTRDSIKLIEYTYKNYELIDINETLQGEFKKWKEINQKRTKIYKGVESKLELDLGEALYVKYPIKKELKKDIWISFENEKFFEAPVEINTRIGNAKVLLNTTEIMNVAIFNNNKIERKGVVHYIKELINYY